jgi:Ca2+-binding EF-hand superfamily protein
VRFDPFRSLNQCNQPADLVTAGLFPDSVWHSEDPVDQERQERRVFMRAEALDRVYLIFRLFDVDRSGDLRAGDFELMGNRVIEAVPDADDAAKRALLSSFDEWWQTLVTELDTNHDGRISFGEFTACVLSPERFDATISLFAESLAALGDPDGDGLIERPLFVALMIAIGFEPGNITALFDAFEPNGSDQIPVPVWVAAIKEYYRPEKAGIVGDHLVGSAAV